MDSIKYDTSLWKTRKWIACNNPDKNLIRIYLYQIQDINQFNLENEEGFKDFVECFIHYILTERICYALRENDLFDNEFCETFQDNCFCEDISLVMCKFKDVIIRMIKNGFRLMIFKEK